MALREGNPAAAAQLLSNVANVDVLTASYRSALETYLEARQLARSHGLHAVAGGICGNLAALYLQLGNLEDAKTTAREGLDLFGGRDPMGQRAQLLMLLAEIASRQRRASEADGLYRDAVSAADRSGDARVFTTALSYYGQGLLDRGDLAAAEPVLLRAYTLESLSRDSGIGLSYFLLGRLRLAQKRLPEALLMADRAIARKDAGVSVPAWNLYALRATVLAAGGRTDEALTDFRVARRDARVWRDAVTPIDALRSGVWRWLNEQLFDPYLDALLADPRFPGDPHLAAEGLSAVEERRAAALRETALQMASSGPRTLSAKLPDAYWQLLARLRAAEELRIAADTPAHRDMIDVLHNRIVEMEAQSVAPSLRYIPRERFSSPDTLSTIQGGLREDQALLSFHLGKTRSSVWAITRHGLEAHLLPPGREIADAARRFRKLVETGAEGRERLGSALYTTLFGALGPAAEARPAWVITADEELFKLPFAALTAPGEGKFLVERHSLLIAPSALPFDRPGGRLEGAPPRGFVGLGDAVYNTADPRWHSARVGFAFPWTADTVSAAVQLPRLPASSEELRASAAAWGDPAPVLLTGLQANRVSLENAVARGPAVIHLAVHVLQPGGHPENAAIGLGLNPNGTPGLLTNQDIAQMRLRGGFVVMSGCSSAAAASAPGAGVLGLMRAWLLAGATAVVGSRWATPDDVGTLFQDFYRGLERMAPRPDGAAEALRLAQVEMLHSGTWRARPSYWASFYVVGKE